MTRKTRSAELRLDFFKLLFSVFNVKSLQKL